jgi:outer membrane protein assembly factor BamB
VQGIVLTSVFGLGWAGATFGADQQWPQFRGVQARGVDESKPLPIRWNVDSGSNVLWQTPIPGLAHASPVIWGDRIYVATAVKPGAEASDLKVGLYGDIEPVNETDPQQWRLLALNRATGKILWDQLGHEAVPRVKRHPKSTHCNSTPATDGKRIVAIFGSEGLFCFDSKGALKWKRDLGPMDSGYFQVPTAQWGFASSPVIHDGKVVVLVDVQTNSFLALFNLADGKEIWRTPRTDVPTWGTPTVIASGKKTQIAVNGWRMTAGYDFRSGENLWRLDGGGDIPVPTPIVGHDLIYLTSAHGRFRPIRAVRVEARGDITPDDPGQTNSAIVWAHARRGNYMQTPILVGKRLFACADTGVLTCFDALTGEVKYSERLSTSGQGFTSSPVSDGRHLYFASEPGTVFVVPVADTFSVAASNDLGETFMSTPAIHGGALFFRTRTKLMAVGSTR